MAALDVANDMDGNVNDLSSSQRPDLTAERHGARSAYVVSRFGKFLPNLGRSHSRRAAITVIIAFWLIQFGGVTMMNRVMYPEDLGRSDVPRAFMSCLGVLISFGMVWVQGRLRSHSLSFRAGIAFLMAVIFPLPLTYLGRIIFNIYFGQPIGEEPQLNFFLQDYLFRMWVFGSLSAMILALSYAGDIQEREERIRRLQALAHSAQLRALRNQLNPHFLFNSLNSIAGLMSRKRGQEAERMTENLADFLRTTLALDPQQLVTLDEEVALQQLYLDIEQVRFPDRLVVHFDIPPDLRNIMVPALITQPLIENSIKYAVARSTAPVALRISARLAEGQLSLTIDDDGGDADRQPSKGPRVGLSNVAERLDAHYGALARLECRAASDRGFTNIISIPVHRK